MEYSPSSHTFYKDGYRTQHFDGVEEYDADTMEPLDPQAVGERILQSIGVPDAT